MTAEMNRRLHAAAGELTDKLLAHETLHMIVEQEYKLRSLSMLTDKQGEALLKVIENKVKNRRQQINKALDQSGNITEKQLHYLNDLIRDLGWSEAYLKTVLKNRYQIYDARLEKLPSYIAIKLIALCKDRIERKQTTQQ